MSVALPVNESANYNQGGVSAAFSPLAEESLVGLFDSRTDVTESSGSVSEWGDGAGVGNATEASFQPDINTQTLNSNPLMNFNFDKMDIPARSVRSCCFLVRTSGLVLAYLMSNDSTYLEMQSTFLSFDGNLEEQGTYILNGDDSGGFPASAENHTLSFTTNTTYLLYCQYDNLITGIDLISASNSINRGAMQLAGIAYFNDVLSDAVRRQYEGYWAHEFGVTDLLPMDHPYKSEAP